MIGRLAVLALALAPLVWGNACSSTAGGTWSTPATWTSCGGVVPGAGDTANVADTKTVTVTDARIVGTSGAAGTVAITLNASGKLVIASGGTLQVRGDTTTTGSGSGPGVVILTVQAGGIWEFDGSVSSAIYVVKCTSAFTYSQISFTGSSGSHATVRSNAGGPNGRFIVGAGAARLGFTATYTDFLRIGDASNSSFDLYLQDSGTFWNVTNSTFASSGAILNGLCGGGCGWQVNTTFIHNNNVHSDSKGAGIFGQWTGGDGAVGTGARTISGNVFDITMSTTGLMSMGGFTSSNNYFGGGWGSPIGTTNCPVPMSGNFFRTTTMSAQCSMSNSYLFWDADVGNPHVLNLNSNFAQVFDGLIVGQGGAATDAGNLSVLLPNSLAGGAVGPYTLKNSILLPRAAGFGTGWLVPILTDTANTYTAIVEHNTSFQGVSGTPWTNGGGTGGIAYNHNATAVPAGTLASFKSNLMFNPNVGGYSAGTWNKMINIGGSGNADTDTCSAAGCDYNATWNMPACATAFTNQGKGYCGNFTTTPGAHDVDATNPQFADLNPRTMEQYDSRGLGNAPAAWSGGGTYPQGAFVSSSTAIVYWGLPVNYRCWNAAGCTGAPQPGLVSHATWDPYWEWATLYRMRQGVAAGSTIIADMMAWVRAGYAPTNIALHNTAHDGTDIGAVAFQAASAGRIALLGVGN